MVWMMTNKLKFIFYKMLVDSNSEGSILRMLHDIAFTLKTQLCNLGLLLDHQIVAIDIVCITSLG